MDRASTYVTLDSRKRLSLGKHATSDAYLLDVQWDGTLVLTPAVALSKIEANLRQRPDLLAQIETSRADGPNRTGRPGRTPHMDAARAARTADAE